MIVKQAVCVVLGVLLLAGAAAAIDLSPSNISSSKPMLVAGGSDQSTITVFALQGPSGTPVSGAVVGFSLYGSPANMGSFSQPSVTTGSDGKAATVYSSGTKSGLAEIQATVSYSDGSSQVVTNYTIVDHATAQYANFSYPTTAIAGSTVLVEINLTDIYGNPVDTFWNSTDHHNVTLVTTSSGNGEGFYDMYTASYVDQVTVPVDSTGKARANYRVSNKSGDDVFIMAPFGNILDTPHHISVTGASHPAYMFVSIAPSSSIPATSDPTVYFTVDYYLTDANGNPANSTVHFSADDGTSYDRLPNPVSGKVRVFFGPKPVVGNYTLTGRTPDNSSVYCVNTGTIGYCNNIVEFFNTSPTDMSLTVNPLNLASLDVDKTGKAVVSARVMDEKGNPVPGETVTFWNDTPTYPGGPYTETVQPMLSASNVNTSGGYATVYFYPGAFANVSQSGYNGTATGQMVVHARWNNIIRNATIVWKNYPYLSISSDSDCSGATVGTAFNVTIRVSGDGAALKPKPVDAMLVSDNSGSMSSTPKMNGPDGSKYKYYYSQVAGRTFVWKMDQTKDKVGLVKFSDSVSLGYNVSNNFAGVITAINQSALGGSTDTRDALKMGVDNMIIDSKNDGNAIKAIILLTDGAWNKNGDPLARNKSAAQTSSFQRYDGDQNWTIFTDWPKTAPEQNVAYYANEHGIRIYTITLGVDDEIQQGYNNTANISTQTWNIYSSMDDIASQTGGKHYAAKDGTQLIDIYTTIAGLLQETAGGSTQADLNFTTVNINSNFNDANITDYLNYTYYNPHSQNASIPINQYDSTYINQTQLNNDGTITVENLSVTDDWNSWHNHDMHFNIGTIKLNESWTTNFRLNITKMGSIELFGSDQPQSKITFVDSVTNTTQIAYIPPKWCNLVEKSPGNRGDANLSIYSLDNNDGTSPFTTTWPIQWKYIYNGSATNGQGEIKYYDRDRQDQIPSQDVPYGWVTIYANKFDQSDYFIISTSDDTKWPPGDTFCVQITGYSNDVDGNPMSEQLCRQKQGYGTGQFIKLQ